MSCEPCCMSCLMTHTGLLIRAFLPHLCQTAAQTQARETDGSPPCAR